SGCFERIVIATWGGFGATWFGFGPSTVILTACELSTTHLSPTKCQSVALSPSSVTVQPFEVKSVFPLCGGGVSGLVLLLLLLPPPQPASTATANRSAARLTPARPGAAAGRCGAPSSAARRARPRAPARSPPARAPPSRSAGAARDAARARRPVAGRTSTRAMSHRAAGGGT